MNKSQAQIKFEKLVAEKKKTMSLRDVFLSKEYLAYLERLRNILWGKGEISINIICDGENGTTAYTDGNRTVVNCETSIATRYASPEYVFAAEVGLFLHEMSHILYLDFNFANKISRVINEGGIYGELKAHSCEERKVFANDVKKHSAFFVKLFNTIDNILADRHDEDMLMTEFPSISIFPISTIRDSLHVSCGMYADREKYYETIPLGKLSLLYNLLLEYSRFGSITGTVPEDFKENKTLMKFSELTPLINSAVKETYKNRVDYINEIMYLIWQEIKEEVKKEQDKKQENKSNSNEGNSGNNGESSGSQNESRGGSNSSKSSDTQNSNSSSDGNSNRDDKSENKNGNNQSGSNSTEISDDMLENILRNGSSSTLEKASPVPKNRITTNRINPVINEDASCNDKSEIDAQKIFAEKNLGELIDGIAQNYAGGKMRELSDEEMEAIRNMNASSSHANIKVIAKRSRTASLNDLKTIERVTGHYAERAAKKLLNEIQEYEPGDVERHRRSGRRVTSRDVYRLDGKCFENNKESSDELPELAICVLVDNSGSMSGEKIKAARCASLMLYDFAQTMGFPISIIGHSTMGDAVTCEVFTEYEAIPSFDRRSIASMSPSNCNRDGLAIEVAKATLLNRPEEEKLLIVISDGAPNHTQYSGESARKDVEKIVGACRRKGIDVYAAAIDKDKDVIKSMYGSDCFLDISKLDEMGKVLVKLLKNKIEKSLL